MSSYEPYVYQKSLNPVCPGQTGWFALVKYKRDVDQPDNPDEGGSGSGTAQQYPPFIQPEYIEVVMPVNPRPVTVRRSNCLPYYYSYIDPKTKLQTGFSGWRCWYTGGTVTYTEYDYVPVRIKNPAYQPPPPPKPDEPPPPPPPKEKLTDIVDLKDSNRLSKWRWSGRKIGKDLASIEAALEELIKDLRKQGISGAELEEEIRQYRINEQKEVELTKDILSVDFIFCGCAPKEKKCGDCCINCCNIGGLVYSVLK